MSLATLAATFCGIPVVVGTHGGSIGASPLLDEIAILVLGVNAVGFIALGAAGAVGAAAGVGAAGGAGLDVVFWEEAGLDVAVDWGGFIAVPFVDAVTLCVFAEGAQVVAVAHVAAVDAFAVVVVSVLAGLARRLG